MQDIYGVADRLIAYAKEHLELDGRNEILVKNRLLEILGKVEGEDFSAEEADEIYGALSLTPREINDKFQSLLKQSAKAATDWFYRYCVSNDYVKKAILDKNPRFEAHGLIVTINKAKPEFRDPKKAVSGNSVAGGYPKCSICRENEGFGGRDKRTLRTVDLTLDGEKWFWQYSPYGYFSEHGIAVNCEHTPMHVDGRTFYKLMDFADLFPHYFIGCNAPLPRIGGSVLAHDHFQGGGEILPMHKAKAAYTLKHDDYPQATVEVVDWQGTVIRTVSKDRAAIAAISEIVRKTWVAYSDPALGIVAEDGEGVHNAVSPTVVKTARGYEMSLILRSNVTNAQYPDGIFHAHPEFHIIKKESIGLIEAQGLFILPGRLESQLGELERLMEEGKPLPAEYSEFALVFDEANALYRAGQVSAHTAMQQELGSICARILDNTAVFKDKRQTVEFLQRLGFQEV